MAPSNPLVVRAPQTSGGRSSLDTCAPRSGFARSAPFRLGSLRGLSPAPRCRSLVPLVFAFLPPRPCGGGSPTAPALPRIQFTAAVSTRPPSSVSLHALGVSRTPQSRSTSSATGVTGVASVFFDVVFNPGGLPVLRRPRYGGFLATRAGSRQLTVPTNPALLAAADAAGRLPGERQRRPGDEPRLGLGRSARSCSRTWRRRRARSRFERDRRAHGPFPAGPRCRGCSSSADRRRRRPGRDVGSHRHATARRATAR